jgi:hypothetical protein
LIHAPHLKSEAKKLWSSDAKQMRWVDVDDFFSKMIGYGFVPK